MFNSMHWFQYLDKSLTWWSLAVKPTRFADRTWTIAGVIHLRQSKSELSQITADKLQANNRGDLFSLLANEIKIHKSDCSVSNKFYTSNAVIIYVQLTALVLTALQVTNIKPYCFNFH